MAKRNTNTNAFRKKINIFLGIGVSLVVVAVMFAISVGGYGKVVHKTLNVQAGTKSIALEDFIIQNDKGYEISLISDLSKVNLSKIGTYPVELQVNKSKVKCEVVVADTEAPTATPVNTTLLAGTTVRAEKLVKDIKDFSSVLVEYKDQPDYSTLGKQNVTIVLTDEYANKREIVVELNITEDNTPPEIKGVKDLRAYVGGTINYRKNVKVTDDHDSNPTFTVDSSKVDISKEGTYTVKYIATDAAGNTAEKTAKVVVSRKVESKEDKKLAAIDLADKVLDNIIKPGMST